MGKCASRERGAGPLRPSRLPAVPRPSDCFKSPTAPKASKLPSSSKEPFISQKEESQNVPQKSPLKDEDDDIDTNVMFNQQEVASQSGRMLLGPSRSTSELLSEYNTAHPSPSRSFSSGGRSPDTLYNSASEDLQDYLASPIRPSGTLLPKYPKFSVDLGTPGSDQPSATSPKPSFYDPNSDDDLFPAQHGSDYVPLEESRQNGVGSKTRLEGSTHNDLRNLASISSLPLPVSQGEDRSLFVPNLSTRKSDAVTPTVGVLRQHNNVALHVVQKPKYTIADRSVSISATPTETRIGAPSGPSEKYSRHLAPSVSLPTRVENRTPLVPAASSKTDILNQSDGDADFGEKWELLSEEPIRNTSLEVTDLPASSTRYPEKYKSPKQELQKRVKVAQSDANSDGKSDLLRSFRSNQSDDIETRDVEGDGEGYVLLGTQPQDAASLRNAPIEEAANHEEHADKGLHTLETEHKAPPLENHSNEAAVKPWPPIAEKAADSTVTLEDREAPAYMVVESPPDKEADVLPTVAKDESCTPDAGGEVNLIKEPTEATLELNDPIQEKTKERTAHMEKEAHAESSEEAPLEEMEEEEVGHTGTEKDYLGPTEVDRKVAPTQETPLDTSLEHETTPNKEEKAPHMEEEAPAVKAEETLLKVHPTEEASPVVADKEVGPPGVEEDTSPTKVTMKQETSVADEMGAESPTSEGCRDTGDNGVKVVPKEGSHIVEESEARVPETQPGAIPTNAEGEDKEEHIQSLWNLKHLKKQPSIGQSIKSKQASQQVKEKAPKVLGLPWPPAPLGSE